MEKGKEAKQNININILHFLYVVQDNVYIPINQFAQISEQIPLNICKEESFVGNLKFK